MSQSSFEAFVALVKDELMNCQNWAVERFCAKRWHRFFWDWFTFTVRLICLPSMLVSGTVQLVCQCSTSKLFRNSQHAKTTRKECTSIETSPKQSCQRWYRSVAKAFPQPRWKRLPTESRLPLLSNGRSHNSRLPPFFNKSPLLQARKKRQRSFPLRLLHHKIN